MHLCSCNVVLIFSVCIVEFLQHNCDPRFFTTVVFYMGSVSMATQLKFEVFDVYDRKESKVSSQCGA